MAVISAELLAVNPENQWRTETPGPSGWPRSPRPDAEKKYFLASMDSHITPPMDLISRGLKPEHRELLPRFEVRDDGSKWMIVPGAKPFALVDTQLVGEDSYRQKAGVISAEDPDAGMAVRIADMDRDGIDFELVFPNGPAIMPYASTDYEYALSVFRIYNDWAAEINNVWGSRVNIVPCITSYNVDAAIQELRRIVKLGHTCVHLPTHPVPTLEGRKFAYNHRMFDPLWAEIEDLGLPILFHVATGGHPARVRGPGGAIMNRQGSHELMADVITFFCASGVLDKHPKLRFNCVEGGGGWVPALLDLMDETYVKHHMWVRPKLKHGLPSEYFREHGMISFQEDRSAMLLVEPYELTNNFTWSNDYPHHEGTWPHSAAAIERQFGMVCHETRAKILGLNGARFLNLEVPAKYLD